MRYKFKKKSSEITTGSYYIFLEKSVHSPNTPINIFISHEDTLTFTSSETHTTHSLYNQFFSSLTKRNSPSSRH